MKLRFQMNCKNLVYLFGGVIFVGSVISGLLTTDKRWIGWHFSRLGEGGMFSSTIFNISIFVAALIVFILSIALVNNITNINNINKTKINRAARIINKVFKIIAFCLFGVSIFPFDNYPTVHNIFGYSMLFTFLYLCIFISKILPIFPQQFYIYGYSILLSTAVCYILFLFLGVISLLTVEMILFSIIYYWLVLFAKGVSSAVTIEEYRVI